MKAKIEKTLSARTRSRVVRAKRSTPKRSEERNERKTDRFRQKVDKKRRKDVHFFQISTRFFQCLHTAHTATDETDAKGRPYSEKWGNAAPSALTHRKKNLSSQQKEEQKTCLSRILVLLLPKLTRKTHYISRFPSHFASTCPSLSPCAAHWVGCPSRALP